MRDRREAVLLEQKREGGGGGVWEEKGTGASGIKWRPGERALPNPPGPEWAPATGLPSLSLFFLYPHFLPYPFTWPDRSVDGGTKASRETGILRPVGTQWALSEGSLGVFCAGMRIRIPLPFLLSLFYIPVSLTFIHSYLLAHCIARFLEWHLRTVVLRSHALFSSAGRTVCARVK